MTNWSVAKPENILTINGGSTSIKFAPYQTGKLLIKSYNGSVDSVGLPGTNLTFSDSTGHKLTSSPLKNYQHSD